MASKIIKNGLIADNEWVLTDHYDPDQLIAGKVILPLIIWNECIDKITCLANLPGLLLRTDQHPADFKGKINSLPIVAIDFPSFTDGRGFSIASILRDRYAFKGEIRACGGIIRDQLFYLRRCGVDSFDFANETNLIEALKSLNTFTDGYQRSANQDKPLFYRRPHNGRKV